MPYWRRVLANITILVGFGVLASRWSGPMITLFGFSAPSTPQPPAFFDDSSYAVRLRPDEGATLPLLISAVSVGSRTTFSMKEVATAVEAALDRRRATIVQRRAGGPRTQAGLPGPHLRLFLRFWGENRVSVTLTASCPPDIGVDVASARDGYDRSLPETRVEAPTLAQLGDMLDRALNDAAEVRCNGDETYTDAADTIRVALTRIDLSRGTPADLPAVLDPRPYRYSGEPVPFFRAAYVVGDTTVAKLTSFGLEAERPGSTWVEVRPAVNQGSRDGLYRLGRASTRVVLVVR